MNKNMQLIGKKLSLGYNYIDFFEMPFSMKPSAIHEMPPEVYQQSQPASFAFFLPSASPIASASE